MHTITDGTEYTPQHGASPSASHHDTPSLPVHALPAQHGTIPSSSHHSTPSPPGYVYPHEHGIRPSSSHHAAPSPSAYTAYSLGVSDKHTSTSRTPPAPHMTSSARSSTNKFRSSIPPAIEEIPDFFRPPTATTEGENPLIHLIAGTCLVTPFFHVATGKMSLVFKSGYLKEGWKWEYVPQSQRDIYWLRWKVDNFTSTTEVNLLKLVSDYRNENVSITCSSVGVLHLGLANVICDI
ncbi:hypothetical protein Syun_021661 [Stephania yunnanensis]|uniref:Uncharacterized protein n=1 Tax=Stephania yunnanensis TaxID=152371 RepID=A0AAP0NQV7_9MAGN